MLALYRILTENGKSPHEALLIIRHFKEMGASLLPA